MKKQTVQQAFDMLPIGWLDSDFKNWFFDMPFDNKRKIKPLRSQKLPRAMTSAEIQSELKPDFVSVEELVATLTTMSHDIWALFYLKDKDGVARLVCASWGAGRGGWSVYANDASGSGQWHGEGQLFSRNSRGTQGLGASDARTLESFVPRSEFEAFKAKVEKVLKLDY